MNAIIKNYRNKLNKYLRKNIKTDNPNILAKALRYSATGSGKRIRPILCIAGFTACNGKGGYIMPIACAVELVHTFSLIHDDLPCMDNDDFRRGKPTCHKVFGEDIAVLAGDALLTMAFEWIADAREISSHKRISIIKELSYCTGSKGLIGGQALDLRISPDKLSLNRLKSIYLKKTAALITSAVKIGAIAASAGRSQMSALTIYGKKLGMAFQIVDDLLDLTQDAEKKISYPVIVGEQKAYRYAKDLIRQAINILKPLGRKAFLLSDIAGWIIDQVPDSLTKTFLDRGPSNSAK